MLDEKSKMQEIATRMHKSGISSREIARVLLGSTTKKSTINNWIAKVKEEETKPKDIGAKILFLDIETAPALAAVFGRRKVFLTPDHIIQEGGQIISYAYSWIGRSVVGGSVMTPTEAVNRDDIRLVKELHNLFGEADAVVAHYGNKFDIPMINNRLAYWRLPVLPTVKAIDTKLMASKRFNFPANSLDSVASYLGLQRKTDSGGIRAWITALQGDTEALSNLFEYNKADVEVLKEVYFSIARFGHSGSDFNAGLYCEDNTLRCAVCSSSNIEETGRSIYTAVSQFSEHRCGDCGAVSRGREVQNTKDKRKNLLMQPKVTG